MSADRALAIAAAALGVLALFGGDTPAPGPPGPIPALEVARALRADPDGVLILDIRDEASYRSFHLPRAVPAPAEPGALVASLDGPRGRAGEADATEPRASSSRRELVIVAGGPEAEARAAWLALRRAGYARARYLPDAAAAWVEEIVSPVLPANADARARAAWAEQAELSRYFGGFPRIRAVAADSTEDAADRLRRARRRGCAF